MGNSIATTGGGIATAATSVVMGVGTASAFVGGGALTTVCSVGSFVACLVPWC